MSGMRRFADRLGKRRVCVDGSDQLFHGALQPECERGLGHQLGGARPDHVHAEHFIVLLVGDDFHEPFRLARHFRAAKHEERKRADPHFEAASSWKSARAMLNFDPVEPKYTAGMPLKSIRIHVRDHKRRELAIADRTIEAHYGSFY